MLFSKEELIQKDLLMRNIRPMFLLKCGIGHPYLVSIQVLKCSVQALEYSKS